MFTKAVKTDAKLRMAIIGPSGSGKTYTALAIATALADGKPIAVVDTEYGSASKYAGRFEFDVAEMTPPYKPDKYVMAIKEAANAGYGVVILDSLTHAWNGEGGLLDIVDNIAKSRYNGNSFAAWKDATPLQKALIEAMLSSNIHVIATMRSKTEYVLEEDSRGKKVPKKVGMAPEQRAGLEYEYDVVLEMSIDNTGVVTKTRCPELREHNEGVYPKPGADVAGILAQWLHGAPKPAQEAPKAPEPTQPANGTPNAPHNGYTGSPLGADVSADEAFGMDKRGDVSQATLKRLDELGREFYGAGWNAKIPELCEHASAGGTQRAADLYESEAQVLIRGIEKRMKQAVTA